ncbi:hypothetical protein PUNSTDRAFT_139067 [Punctularia strigosozonata HHB-11173 SS5]|uniref:BTB domain-containing protein n=1 Tax=Punctularia strigosozonata (strain HHB-11173) TaxID=741275 RepID=R7S458_PUNST|nr:uncharacterized protein PUNSTDRAFT_139067 [Punctularia strigosozonata HHB-11173 SS5]EIN04026.1 hypothetical protein PUNSTDRAFT_139067 [Punctularia strigosozonata HHB-11173 SS5]
MDLQAENNSEASAAPPHHPDYYIEDGNLVLLVDGILFRIHRYFFKRDSEVFRTMFSLPAPDGHDVEGLSDDTPIRLEGTSADAFALFLWMYYCRISESNFDKTMPEWETILQVSHKYQFDDITSVAYKVLSQFSQDPVSQILTARKYSHTGVLLRAGFQHYAERPEPLSVEEADKLGLADVVNLTRFRDKAKAQGMRDLDPIFHECASFYRHK